jgi:hypothetical protein
MCTTEDMGTYMLLLQRVVLLDQILVDNLKRLLVVHDAGLLVTDLVELIIGAVGDRG